MRLKSLTTTLLSSLTLSATLIGADLTQVPLAPEEFTTPPDRSKPGILWFWSQTEMTDDVIREQMDEMKAAGFGSIMMFPLQYKPKFYSEHFYERYAVVLEEAKKRDMGIWMTVDSAIPTGHGAQKVVGGGKVNEELTLEPREDLRAQILLHGPAEVAGSQAIDLQETFPGISNLPSTIRYQQNAIHIRKAPMVSLVEGSEWTDYSLKTNLTANNWAGNPLIVAGYIDNGVLFRWDKETSSGYAWSLADQSELDKGIPVLRRAVYKDGKILNRLPSIKIEELEHGKKYDLEVRVKGSSIESYINGKLVDTLEDKTYSSGSIGIYTPHLARSIFHKLEVSNGDEVLFTENFTNPDGWVKWAPKAPIEEVFAVSAIPRKEGKLQSEGILDLTDQFTSKQAWNAPAGEWKIEYFMKRKALKMPYNYPDLFNDEVILRHQQVIYEEMYRRFPEYMGTTIRGFWSDEPHRTDDDVWSESFPAKMEALGVNVAETLSAVYNDLGRGGRSLQTPYFKLVYESWTEPFAKIQGEWCKARGLDWMTNPTCDSAPPYGGYSAGNALQMNQWSNAPGVDAIFGQILPGKRSYISRWATSSANQLGNQHVLYEVYGGYGWHVPPHLVRYVNGFLLVRGCNRVSYHAYWSNPEAVGYAPPFDPSSTWWHAQDELNMWNARLQEANLGKAISNVALLVSNSTQYADHLNLPGRLFNQHWGEAYYALEDIQSSFDLLDESNINDNPIMHYKGNPVDGGLKVEEQMYNVIVVPGANTLSLKAAKTLKETAEKGGIVIGFRTLPKEEYAAKDEELATIIKELFGDNPSSAPHQVGKGWTALAKDADTLKALIAQTDTKFVDVAPANEKIQILKRVRQNGVVYLVMNEGEEAVQQTLTFKEEGTPEIWNPENGDRKIAPVYNKGDGTVSVKVGLTPYQTKVIAFMHGVQDVAYVTDSLIHVDSVSEKGGEVVAHVITRKTGEQKLTGQFAGKSVTGSVTLGTLPAEIGLNKEWKISYADQPEERKATELVSWTTERPKYSGTASYTTSFNFPTEAKKEGLKWELDLGDVRDVARVIINGKELPTILWTPYTTDLTAYLKPGANAIEVKVSNTLENKHVNVVDSGLLGPVVIKPYHSTAVTLKN